jgi:AmiR/NasT family two-component response regulator
VTETKPTRVLIAEDEALIRLDLREMLVEEGFEVVAEAGDGEQAVELTRQLAPDVVICDVKMPRMDGITAAGQIGSEGLAAVVMLTAFSQQDLVSRAAEAGAMAYLVKPFQKRDLLPAIEIATARFAQMRGLSAEVTDLKERLEARKVIERAKGILMIKHSLTEPEAFRWIQRAAMDHRTSMRAVADLVLQEDSTE